MFLFLICYWFERRNLLDGRDDLFGGDEACAFELAVVALVAGAPEEVEVVEILPHVVPAGVAGVVIDDTVWRMEFIRGMCETADHHQRDLAAPRHPRQAAGQADEEVCVLYQIDTFLQRDVAREILRSPWDVVPMKSRAVDFLLVDAQDAVSVVFQELDDGNPAERIVPVFRLGGRLRRNADVLFFDLPRCGEVEARRQVVQIVSVEAENVARRAVEADVAEVDGLVVHVALEEQPHVVRCVGFVLYSVLRGDERDVWILVFYECRDPRRHDADQLAMMLQLETFHVGEPSDAVSNRADGQLHHDLLVTQVHVMLEDGLVVAFFVDDETEPDVELLDGRHEGSGHRVVAVEDDAGVDVHERHMVRLPVVREEDADAVVEIELDAFHGIQHGDLRDFTIDGLLGALRPLLAWRKIRIARRFGRPGRRGDGGGSRRGGVDADVADRSAKVRVDGEIRHDYSLNE